VPKHRRGQRVNVHLPLPLCLQAPVPCLSLGPSAVVFSQSGMRQLAKGRRCRHGASWRSLKITSISSKEGRSGARGEEGGQEKKELTYILVWFPHASHSWPRGRYTWGICVSAIQALSNFISSGLSKNTPHGRNDPSRRPGGTGGGQFHGGRMGSQPISVGQVAQSGQGSGTGRRASGPKACSAPRLGDGIDEGQTKMFV